MNLAPRTLRQPRQSRLLGTDTVTRRTQAGRQSSATTSSAPRQLTSPRIHFHTTTTHPAVRPPVELKPTDTIDFAPWCSHDSSANSQPCPPSDSTASPPGDPHPRQTPSEHPPTEIAIAAAHRRIPLLGALPVTYAQSHTRSPRNAVVAEAVNGRSKPRYAFFVLRLSPHCWPPPRNLPPGTLRLAL